MTRYRAGIRSQSALFFGVLFLLLLTPVFCSESSQNSDSGIQNNAQGSQSSDSHQDVVELPSVELNEPPKETASQQDSSVTSNDELVDLTPHPDPSVEEKSPSTTPNALESPSDESVSRNLPVAENDDVSKPVENRTCKTPLIKSTTYLLTIFSALEHICSRLRAILTQI